jgi:hypothetical protein
MSSSLSTAWALDLSHPKYRLQTRRNAAGQTDRREGIEPVKIAGEHLELIGAFLNVPTLQPGVASTTYHLGFYLKEAESRIDIKVRDYDVFRGMHFIYWMLPLRTQYARGFGSKFMWEASLSQGLGIGLQDLGAVAWIRGYSRPMVAPLLLHTDTFPALMQVEGSRFVFMPNTAMTVDYHIYPKGQQERLVKQGRAVVWSANRQHAVVWNGKDPQGRSVPEGVYILDVSATYTPAPGRPERKLPFDVAFYYTPMIATRASQP